MSKIVKNIVHYREIGTDENGKKKSFPTTIGVIMQTDSGHLRMKINYIPTDWDGWTDVFDYEPPKKKEQNPF